MNEWIDIPIEAGWYWMRVNEGVVFMVLVEKRGSFHSVGQQLHYSRFKEKDCYPVVERANGWQRIPDAVLPI